MIACGGDIRIAAAVSLDQAFPQLKLPYL